VLSVSLTARDLLQKIAHDTGTPYRTIAERVNKEMVEGMGFMESVQAIAAEFGLSKNKYGLDSVKIVAEIEKILKQDYSQTLMISAVLAQMVESEGADRFPAPAFFAFLEILSKVREAPRHSTEDSPVNIDENTTRIIELTTTLVSIVCEWSEEGVVGVSDQCPKELNDVARTIYRRTKLLQSGMWACISCGTIVDVKQTRALMCPACDGSLSENASPNSSSYRERERLGYGKSSRGEEID
jgi:hypothetical protein